METVHQIQYDCFPATLSLTLVVVVNVLDYDIIVSKFDFHSHYYVQQMDTATRVQILADTNCISHSTNTLGKGLNPIIIPPAMGK